MPYQDFGRLKDNTSILNLCGIDIETTAIDDITGDIEKIWCISWYYSDKAESRSVFWKDGITKEELSFQFENCGSLSQLSPDIQNKRLLELRQVLTCETKYIPCFHNLQFELRHLTECGLYIPYFHDTMIMGFCCVTPAMMNANVGEDDNMRFYSLRHMGEIGLCDSKLEFSNQWDKFTDEMLTYNQGDATSCTQIARHLLSILIQDTKTFDAYIIDLCAGVMCMEMNKNGVYIDPDKLTEVLIEKEKEHDEIRNKLLQMTPAVAVKEKRYVYPKNNNQIVPISVTGIYKRQHIGKFVPIGKQGSEHVYKLIEQFSPTKPDHVLVALKHHCDWQPTKFSAKTGKPSVDKSVVNQLSDRYVFARVLLQFRKVDKLLSTYLRPFQDTDEFSRIHPSFLTCATVTSRLASRSPNFQNIPRGDARRLVTASSEKYKIVCIDLSQIELRILAWYMAMIVGQADPQSSYLWKLYEKDADVHAENQRMMGAKERKHAKNAIFLYIYGGGAARLAATVDISIPEAKEILQNMQNNITALPTLKKIIEKSAERKRVLRTLLGHKIVYPNLWESKSNDKIHRAKRQYFNAIIQGTQADIIKVLMWKARHAMESCGARILMQIHDELVYEVPVGNVPWFCDELDKLFNTRAILKGLKIAATPGYGDSWAEAKESGERLEKEKKNVAA